MSPRWIGRKWDVTIQQGGREGWWKARGWVGVLRWFELSRQSLLPSLLFMPANYQGGWPSSCKPSLHDVVINARGYRVSLQPVFIMAAERWWILHWSGKSHVTVWKMNLNICILETFLLWRVKSTKEICTPDMLTNKWVDECWDKLSLSAPRPPESLPGWSRLPRNSWGLGESC